MSPAALTRWLDPRFRACSDGVAQPTFPGPYERLLLTLSKEWDGLGLGPTCVKNTEKSLHSGGGLLYWYFMNPFILGSVQRCHMAAQDLYSGDLDIRCVHLLDLNSWFRHPHEVVLPEVKLFCSTV